MRRIALVISAMALAAWLLAPGAASAATEFGDNCVANEYSESTEAVTVFAITAPGNLQPLQAPSAGVITKWKFNAGPAPVPFPVALDVLRQSGQTVQVVGEATQIANAGLNVFDARIPIQAGDRLGYAATPGPIALAFCLIEQPSAIGAYLGNLPAGSSAVWQLIPAEARLPVAALIEPDADGDGFGDETQDQCPQTALAQGPCPTVAVDLSTVVKRKGSVIAFVSTSATAPVTVTGNVKLGKGRKAKLSSKPQTIVPGKVSRFTLKFPKKLKAKLEDLQRKRSLQLKLTASATDLIGRVTTDKLKTKLKGQASPGGK